MAIDRSQAALGQFRVRSSPAQAERLLGWASQWEQRVWAIEGAGGLGYLLGQQLLSAGEVVVDVSPKLAARVRLLASGKSKKNDPNDARAVAIPALRSSQPKRVHPEDHAAVLRVWAKRNNDLGRLRNKVACRLHLLLCDLVPGGIAKEIRASHAAELLEAVNPAGAVERSRKELAEELLDDLRRQDEQMKASKKGLTAPWPPQERRSPSSTEWARSSRPWSSATAVT